MKKAGIIFLVGLIFSCVFLFLFSECSGKKSKFDLSTVRFEEGDIIFRRGIGAKSNAVSSADKKGIYSHVGIIVKRDSVFMVIHITPGEREKGENEDKIKIESPEQFFSSDRAQYGAVIRLKDSLEYSANAAQEAFRLLEEGTLFDHDYLLEDSGKMYCTEMIWRAYLSGGKDITRGRRSIIENFPLYSGTYIFPSDIFDNDEFTLIYKF
jgi:uncharacterized protein YycO